MKTTWSRRCICAMGVLLLLTGMGCKKDANKPALQNQEESPASQDAGEQLDDSAVTVEATQEIKRIPSRRAIVIALCGSDIQNRRNTFYGEQKA